MYPFILDSIFNLFLFEPKSNLRPVHSHFFQRIPWNCIICYSLEKWLYYLSLQFDCHKTYEVDGGQDVI